MVLDKRAAAAFINGTCCLAFSTVMRTAGAETAMAATGWPLGPNTGTATQTTPARNSWLSIDAPERLILCISSSICAGSVIVLLV